MKNNITAPAHDLGDWRVSPQIGPEGIECYRIQSWNAERTFARTLASTTTATPEDEANAALMAAALRMKQASEALYNAVNYYLTGDRNMPEYLTSAFDSMEAAWNMANVTALENPAAGEQQ